MTSKFKINEYQNGYTVVEVSSGPNRIGVVLQELAQVYQAPSDLKSVAMFGESEAQDMADSLNTAAALVYKLEVTTSLRATIAGALSYGANEVETTRAYTFQGPLARKRAVEAYDQEVARDPGKRDLSTGRTAEIHLTAFLSVSHKG